MWVSSCRANVAFQGRSSSSRFKEVPGLFEQIMASDVLSANVLVELPDGKQWLCSLAVGEPLFVRECCAWFYEEQSGKWENRALLSAQVSSTQATVALGRPHG